MTAAPSTISVIYSGWHSYQETLITALRPLTNEQLALCAAPGLRSIAQITAHMVAGRANWFYRLLNEGGELFHTLGTWARPELAPNSAAVLIEGLESTWEEMQAAITRWTPQDWDQPFSEGHPYAPMVITRMWMIWHLIEHDLHHGGEISLTLGVHGLTAPDL